MSYSKYSLDVVSHHSEFMNKILRKYNVDGIDTIGAYGDESFEIRFTNHTSQKIQVKISLDGTDILTGSQATTDISRDMWVVNGYGTLNLRAWPETHNGGAAFVFTGAHNSVAAHTHGDMSSRGIIAAAVFTEGYVNPNHIIYHYPYWDFYGRSVPTYDYNKIYCGSIINNSGLTSSFNSTSEQIYGQISTNNSVQLNETSFCNNNLVSVGAGQHVDQKITYTSGLIKPLFSETIRVRYLWWDELKSKLVQNNVPAPHASGFPGNKNQNIMSIGNTPRVGSNERLMKIQEATYSRI